jgi:hypothetical protein
MSLAEAATPPAPPAELTSEPKQPGPRDRRRALMVAAGLYLLGAIILWWGVWSSHPTTTTTCGCGDAARFLWFFEWPTFALTHGHSLFYSQWLFHPTGINLLDDTSVLALGIVLSPVTLAFGPVAAMNVALTLAPCLSALAMFVLLRRWVTWSPAAFVGGLAYGFSPFLITELALNQLNIAFMVIPPLLVIALDELLVRQRRSPYRVGAALAALLVVQFFISTEVLLISVVFALVAVGLIAGYMGLTKPDVLRLHGRYALRGSLTALAVTAVILAYPLWFLLRGPAHLSGPIWSTGSISQFGNSLTSLWSVGSLGQIGADMTRFGGYQGPGLPGLGYLGLGVVVVAVGGTVLWWRDRRLLLFGGVGLLAFALSLQPGSGHWVPWSVLRRVPWLGDIVEVRFTVVISLCAAVMVGIVLDRSRTWVIARRRGAGTYAGTVVGAGLALLTLIPSVTALWSNLPLTAQSVVLPRWYAEVGAHLPPGQVVLSYPAPFSGLQASQAWQAVNHMRYSQAGGGGPEGQADRAGRAKAGFEVLVAASLPLGPAPSPTAANLAAIRSALTTWRVTMVVIPDQRDLPLYAKGRSNAYAVGLFTAALGRPPAYSHAAWVWTGVTDAPPPTVIAPSAFTRCTIGPASSSSHPLAVPICITGAPG